MEYDSIQVYWLFLQNQLPSGILAILDNFAERSGFFPALDRSSICPINLIVVYWTTMVITGDGELGFDSGEGA